MADARLRLALEAPEPPWLRRAAVVLAWAFGAVALVATPWLPAICPLRLVAHVPCPSCGLTRATRLLFQGDLAGATRMHPLWWVVLPFLGTVAVLEATTYVRTGRVGTWAERRGVQRSGMVIAGLLVVVWVARAFGAFGGPVDVG